MHHRRALWQLVWQQNPGPVFNGTYMHIHAQTGADLECRSAIAGGAYSNGMRSM